MAWLSLDAGDHDPARFLTYLVAGICRVGSSAFCVLRIHPLVVEKEETHFQLQAILCEVLLLAYASVLPGWF